MTAYGEDFLFYNLFILWNAVSSPIWGANKSHQSAGDVQGYNAAPTFPGTQTGGNMLEESQRCFRRRLIFFLPQATAVGLHRESTSSMMIEIF